MATTIACNGSVVITADGYAVASYSLSKVLTMVGNKSIQALQLLALGSYQALNLGALATCGKLFVINLDTTNYVELSMSADSTKKFCKIRAGDFAILEPSALAVYGQPNTAAVSLLIIGGEV